LSKAPDAIPEPQSTVVWEELDVPHHCCVWEPFRDQAYESAAVDAATYARSGYLLAHSPCSMRWLHDPRVQPCCTEQGLNVLCRMSLQRVQPQPTHPPSD